MRDFKFGRLDDHVLVKKDIQVDGARALGEDSLAADFRFDCLNYCQKLLRRKVGFRFHAMFRNQGCSRRSCGSVS